MLLRLDTESEKRNRQDYDRTCLRTAPGEKLEGVNVEIQICCPGCLEQITPKLKCVYLVLKTRLKTFYFNIWLV